MPNSSLTPSVELISQGTNESWKEAQFPASPRPGRVARKWPGWARQLTAPPPGLSLSQGWAKSRLGESSPALHLKKSRRARRRQRLEEGLELLRVKCNCETMVSKYAIGQGERYSREVNKFSLRILTYHKKESKDSIRTYFYKHLHKHKQALFENHRERRASRSLRSTWRAVGAQVVMGWPADHPVSCSKG